MGSDKSSLAMQVLADKIKQLTGPILFAGDLNVSYESPAMRLFDNWLEDLTHSYNIQETLSQFGKAKNVACDHILVSPEIKVNSFTVSEELVSDHKALVLEFEI